jgi:GH24 family phage-related lysozyme (muramidase)
MADPFDLYDFVKREEGYNPRAYWDHKQWSIGHGTRAIGPNEFIDRSEADRRLRTEVDKAGGYVDQAFPGLDPQRRGALASFTYNLGPGWIGSSRLAAAVKSGDWASASRIMQEYNRASGQPNAGLLARRKREADLFLSGGPSAPQPPDGMDAATYGASPPPSPRMALGGPKPMPIDPQTGEWVPEQEIARRRALANQMWDVPTAPGWAGGLAKLLGGGVHGYQNAKMNQAIAGNQRFSDAATERALQASDLTGVYQALASGSPEQKKSALSLMLQEKDPNRELERQAKQLELKERLMRIQGAQDLFGGGAPSASAGQPPPAASAPALPSGLPGVTTVGGMPIPTPGFTPGQPTPSPVVGMPTPSTKPEMSDAEKIQRLPAYKRAALKDAFLNKNPKFAEMLDEALDPGKKGRESYDTEFAKKIVEDFNGINDAGRKALTKLGDYDVLEALVKNPNVLQGPGAERFSLPLRRSAEFMGIKTEGLPPTQLFQALINKLALEARNPAGGAGMPGSMSDADREFLRTMVPSIGNTPEGNAALIQIHKRIAQREIEVSRAAINYAKNNGGRIDLGFYDALAQWSQAKPMWSDKEKAALSGGAPPAAAPGSPAVGAAPAPAPAQDQKQEIMARQARRDAAPPGAIDDEFLREDGRTERRKKGQDGVWRPVSTGEEANLALKGLGEDIASSPAAKFLRWLQSQTGTSANAAQPPIEGAP